LLRLLVRLGIRPAFHALSKLKSLTFTSILEVMP
jgi:hypothetical protein